MTCNSCIHFGVCRLENESPTRCQHFMPNIVHCKDCKFCYEDEINFLFCNHPDCRNPLFCHPDDFCNNGVKK